ncbi:MAG: site-2 protease family protein [Spirochaetia bacterium]|nr:site-2 protease family protein [Spirochaetia bacterium]
MITTILAIAFLLGICIFVHELGHFLIGKWVGVQPRVFSIGYGRGIFFKKKGKTIYQITAIPLGGYVQFYGDDITKSHENVKKGDFFSVGPWRRMALAFGGPLFSLLFGVMLIFILISGGWRPATNEIRLFDETPNTPAHQAGLKNGDKVIEVDGVKTDYFEKVNLYIALAAKNQIKLKIDREGKIFDTNVNAVSFEAGGPLHIGIRPKGEKFLIVKKSKRIENAYLKENDKIVSVDGKKIEEIEELREILDKNKGKKINIVVEREKSSLIDPNRKETMTVAVPVQSFEYIKLTNIKDLQTEKIIPEIEIGQWDPTTMQSIVIKGRSYSNWSDFSAAVKNTGKSGKNKLTFSIGPVDVESNLEFHTRGLMGISLDSGLSSEKMNLPANFFNIMALTFDYSVVATQSTLLGLYRIVEGKLSFRKSISGPVKIMKLTADSIKYGWDVYWMLFAQITIVLGIMNLLPIPVLDGGHILMYLIEAIYKPIPTKIIAGSMRIGVVLLMMLGIYVIFLDIWDIFIAGVF